MTHNGWNADKLIELGQAHVIIRKRIAQGWKGLVQKLKEVVG
ncbi:hypothetical protein [Paenibacillus barcinonensis]|nr:hypothetical protein [Paenibacillus barcinonensis]